MASRWVSSRRSGGVNSSRRTPRWRRSKGRRLLPQSVSAATSIDTSIRAFDRVPEPRPARGIIDTSVVIELEGIDPLMLPSELAISAVTLAELAAGPHVTTDAAERAK